MARTNITKTAHSRGGAQPAMVAVDASAAPNGMMYDWTATAEVVVRNTDTNPHTMTVQIPVLVDGQAVTAKTVTIPASTVVAVVGGPYGAEYRQADGKVYLNFDAATGMTIGVMD
jgi:archaellum component FlaG (FlaF/FlaG flagellin family)